MNVYEFGSALKECKSAVYDLDNTLVEGRVAQGMGKRFLASELGRFHLRHVWLGITNYGKVKRIAEGSGEAYGLEYLFDVIGRTGCANKAMMEEFARDYIQKHGLPGSKEFADYLREFVVNQFVSTASCDIAAIAACDLYGLGDYTANPVIYSGSVVKSCEPMIRTEVDKLYYTERMLERHGLSLSGSLVVGNDRLDHKLMEFAGVKAASPLADEETRRIADFWIEDYAELMEELERV